MVLQCASVKEDPAAATEATTAAAVAVSVDTSDASSTAQAGPLAASATMPMPAEAPSTDQVSRMFENMFRDNQLSPSIFSEYSKREKLKDKKPQETSPSLLAAKVEAPSTNRRDKSQESDVSHEKDTPIFTSKALKGRAC